MKHSTLMDTDDLEPIIKPKEIDFDTLSIEELREYIIELNAEIKRAENYISCLLYTSPSPRDGLLSRMPSSA